MEKENYVRPAILADVLQLAPKMRKADREEVRASNGVSPLEALMGQGYTYIYNWVDRRNWKSLKWLQFLGFEPKEEIKEYGVGKLPFLLMIKEMNKE